MKIGVFDSGIGGFTVASALYEKHQFELVYLADQAHLPYGSKDPSELLKLVSQNINWFISQDIGTILIACNTVSSLINELRELFPKLNLISIIEETVKQIQNEKKLLILGTNQTVQSLSYLKLLNNDIDSKQVALPELASLIEDFADDEVIYNYLKPLLKPYKKEGRRLVLACTHYPLVLDLIKKASQSEIINIDYKKIKLANSVNGSSLTVYTTGKKEIMEKQLRVLYNIEVSVKEVYDEIFISE